MQYPLISEYVRAIQDASNNLDELAHLVPVLDDHGEPYRSSGAFAVVFKMKDEQTGKCYALKCFTEEQEGRAEAYRQIADELAFVDSSYITSVKYLDKEIFVDSCCEEDEFPVLLMDWIDGETMENYIAENYQDNYAMSMLCYRFCKMAAWLCSQPFAHGDIKPDNIMVRPDGNLTLVDYDGMFVPAMKGQKSPTIGTKDFSHPLRTVDDFDETIDDFALASIALSLKAISLKSSLLDEYGAADRLLFSAEDYRDLSKSKVLAALQELMNNEEMNTLLSMFFLVNAKKALELCSFKTFYILKPCKEEELNSNPTEAEIQNGVIDDFGVLYSKDWKKLIKAPLELSGNYNIRYGVKVICDAAFRYCDDIFTLSIPEGVTVIGFMAFAYCTSLVNIYIPSTIKVMVDCAFFSCIRLYKAEIPVGVRHIASQLFDDCQSLTNMMIPNGVLNVEAAAFRDCYSLEKINIPSGVSSIGDSAFENCKSLKEVSIPDSVLYIGEQAFSGCSSLFSIIIPSSVKEIGEGAFYNCKFSQQTINDIIERFGNAPFVDVDSKLDSLLKRGIVF